MVDLNPIWRREMRSRWRGPWTYVLVLGYAGLLALAMWWIYAQAKVALEFRELSSNMPGLPGRGTAVRGSALLGRELFAQFTMVQMLGWMLLAPVLTAPSIAGERERGLLESLHLSPLSPAHIASGKLLSALSLVALLLLVPLPIVAMCFPLGGVSPWEFALALLLQASTAVSCAALGLACSARSRHTTGAIATALALVAVWNLLPPLALFGPLFVSLSLFGGGRDIEPLVFFAVVFFVVALQGAATLLLLRNAASTLLQPMPDLEPGRVRRAFGGLLGVLQPETAPVAAPVGVQQSASEADAWNGSVLRPRPAKRAWSAAVEQRSRASAQSEDEDEAEPPVVERWDMPLANRLRFDNPLLQREVRVKLRLREEAVGMKGMAQGPGCLIALGLFFVVFGIGLALVPNENDFSPRKTVWGVFSFLWLFSVVMASSVMGALSFTREREQAMLEPLLLSALSPHEVLWGKLSGTLVVCAYYSLALLAVLPPCLHHLTYPGRDASGIALTQAIATLLIVAATAWCCAAWGMLLSWRSRSTLSALGVTLGAMLLGFGLAPMFIGLGMSGASSAAQEPSASGRLHLWHPFVALGRVLNPGEQSNILRDSLALTLLLLAAGLMALALLYSGARHGPREPDKKHRAGSQTQAATSAEIEAPGLKHGL